MPAADTLYLAKAAIVLIVQLSMPIIIAATVAGLLMALLQALIQVQEQTLSFIVKLITVVALVFATGPSLSARLLRFIETIFEILQRQL